MVCIGLYAMLRAACCLIAVFVCISADDDFIPVDDASYALPPAPVLGEMLLRFLKFYGSEFNSDLLGVSVRIGSWFAINRALAMFVDPVVIPDPVDETNNVGRNCFRFQQIQVVFLRAYHQLLESYNSPDPRAFANVLFPSWSKQRLAQP